MTTQVLIFYRSASLFFGDIVGFTKLTAMSTAVQTIEFLNDLYHTFDAAIERYDVYKVNSQFFINFKDWLSE